MLQQTQVARVVPRYLALARALAVGRGARRRDARGRDPRVAGARLQPPRAQPAPRRAAGSPPRAGRDDLTELPGVGRVHRRRRRAVRLRPAGASRRRERAPRARPDRRLVRAGFGTRADGPRRDGLPRPDPALRRVSARRRLPVARKRVTSRCGSRAVRGLVPATARPDADSRRRAAPPSQLAGRGRRRRTGRRRPRPGASAASSACLASSDPLNAKTGRVST